MSLHVKSVNNVRLTSDFHADVMITGVTGEPRGWDVHQRLAGNCSSRWFVVQLSPALDANSLTAQVTARDGTGIVLSIEEVGHRLKAWLNDRSNLPKSVLIDVSCMSRPAMAQVFAAISDSAKPKGLSVTVTYSIAEYTSPPTHLPPNEDISPVSEAFAGWPSYPGAVTTLILGVGYEQDKAQGALEYFDPSDYWLFVPRSPIHEYDLAVLQNNENLVASAQRQQRLYDYSVMDPSHTFGVLASVVSGMIGRANPVILPFGPKIFFALSLLVASIYKELGVWHVTGELMASAPDYCASAHSVAFQVEFA
jgi:hypothetical protein